MTDLESLEEWRWLISAPGGRRLFPPILKLGALPLWAGPKLWDAVMVFERKDGVQPRNAIVSVWFGIAWAAWVTLWMIPMLFSLLAFLAALGLGLVWLLYAGMWALPRLLRSHG